MTYASPRSLELVRTDVDRDLSELATVAETLSILERWIRALPGETGYEELSRQIRLAETEARRLLEDENAEFE